MNKLGNGMATHCKALRRCGKALFSNGEVKYCEAKAMYGFAKQRQCVDQQGNAAA